MEKRAGEGSRADGISTTEGMSTGDGMSLNPEPEVRNFRMRQQVQQY